GAHCLRIAAGRVGVRLGEEVGRNLVAYGIQNLEFQSLWNWRSLDGAGWIAPFQLVRHPIPCQLGSVEIACDAGVWAEKAFLGHLVEMEGEIERATQAGVPELSAPGIENEPLAPADIADGKFLQNDSVFATRGKIIVARPAFRGILITVVDMIGVE